MSGKPIPFMMDESGRIRVLVDGDGTPWICLKDTCRMLGITDIADVMVDLTENETTSFQLGFSGSIETYIHESGLYLLIMRSEKPMGQDFCLKLAGEVVPTALEKGTYKLDIPAEVLDSPEKVVARLETVLARLGAPLRFKLIRFAPKRGEPWSVPEAMRKKESETPEETLKRIEATMEYFGLPLKCVMVSGTEKED
jgi:prophage antirepressor-like protein